jgi:hypothetical protein
MSGRARRVTAGAVAACLVALVIGDISFTGFQTWFDRHSFTSSIISSLLVLAVTGFIVDEIVARRQRKDRATSVTVQALIVYGQCRRAWQAVKSSASGHNGAQGGDGSALEEWRSLANMLLSASPALFEDPEARRFLEEVERFSGLLLTKIHRSDGALADGDLQLLENEFEKIEDAVRPLMARLPDWDESLFEGPD